MLQRQKHSVIRIILRESDSRTSKITLTYNFTLLRVGKTSMIHIYQCMY